MLEVGPAPARFPCVDVAPLRPLSHAPILVRALPGPRADWLADPQQLTSTSWTVSSRSDRVGIRLEGTALRHHPDPAWPGAAQRRGRARRDPGPPGGEPVLFLADHPVTGGYPVAAVVRDADVDRLAQAVPGQVVRICIPGLLSATTKERP